MIHGLAVIGRQLMSRTTTAMLLLIGSWSLSGGSALAQNPTTSDSPVLSPQAHSVTPAPPVPQRLGDWFDHVDLQDITARQFIEWWSLATGIPVVVNWEALEAQGIDPNHPVTLQLHRLPAGQVLALGMQLISIPPAILMYERTDHALELLTKSDANRRTVTRVYSVASRMHLIDEEPLPRANTTGMVGGSRGAGTMTLDGRGRRAGFDRAQARWEAGERLAQDLRDLIEPTLWREHGGEHGSMRFVQDRLVVTAPRYVQNQVAEFLGIIGWEGLSAGSAEGVKAPMDVSASEPPPAPKPISAIQTSRSSPVSGVQGR